MRFSLQEHQHFLRSLVNATRGRKLLDMLLRPALPFESERLLRSQLALIDSMTVKEREHPNEIDATRFRRIAHGSGLPVEEARAALTVLLYAIRRHDRSSGRGRDCRKRWESNEFLNGN